MWSAFLEVREAYIVHHIHKISLKSTRSLFQEDISSYLHFPVPLSMIYVTLQINFVMYTV